MKTRYKILIGILVILGVLCVMGRLTRLPDNSQRRESFAIADGDSTTLGQAFRPLSEQHPGQSGVYLLGDGRDAFVARAVLARLAERSIDLQYYMFHHDTVGRLLIKELLAAADRGVRVRMLIDDMYGEDGDEVWSALDSHPSCEVRLFNPFVRGRSKNLQFLTRLKTVNHRMHSKSFTVDNQASILGGRNIGDEYFNANPDLAFSDLDVLTIGSVVPEVSDAFDLYWNSEYAYPIGTLLDGAVLASPDTLRSELEEFSRQQKTSVYVDALEHSAFAAALRQQAVNFSMADAELIHDSSDKLIRGKAWKEDLLIAQLAPYVQQADKEFILVSPYFVPGRKGADALCELSQKGVQVRILTNSLVSNDVAAVHTAYIRHRKKLLRCGVELYEFNEQLKTEQSKLFSWLPGLSKSSLHAKTMAIDRERMFVGSFNFDLRSLYLNNEIGVVFYEPGTARQSSENFVQHIEQVAFKVELVPDEKGRESLRWTGIEQGKKVVFDDEPYASFWLKLGVNLLRLLPIDSML